MCGSTTKVPALAAVQSVELFRAESLTEILSRFSTEFSTVVLKTSSASSPRAFKNALQENEPPEKGRLQANLAVES
jgi:hypothetical protein